ncbi:MAG: glutaredoxin domain-containing protein [Moraxellaceae bacterium]|nr:glutaredoxin domain-containing protein [Moraxellaceae bacterium]
MLVLGSVYAWQHHVAIKRWWLNIGQPVPTPLVTTAVQVFTREGCHYCEEAVELLEEAGVPVLRRVVDQDEVARAEFEAAGGDLPLIVDGRRHYNGYNPHFLKEWYVKRPRNQQLLDRIGVYRQGEARLPVLYGADWCGYCTKARQYFNRHGIAFRDLDIERDDEARRHHDALGFKGVPVIVYEDMVWSGFGVQMMEEKRLWVEAR